MSNGVLIFEGMQVGILPGDFEISIGENGDLNHKLMLSTSYNVIPIWLLIASNHYLKAKAASEDLKLNWNEDTENQKKLLLTELEPSMQTFVACGIALDGLYDALRSHAKITTEDIEKWKKNKTSRGKQIVEVIRRVYKIKSDVLITIKKSIPEIIRYRDMAVHPDNQLKNACVRSDIPVGVDWKFSAFKFNNASICFQSTMNIFIYLHDNPSKIDSVDTAMENIFKSLLEFGVIKKNSLVT